VTLPGDQGDVSVYYSPGKGGKVITAAGTLDVPVDALDLVGLEPTDTPEIPEHLAALVAAGAIEIEPAASPSSGLGRPE
jgi:hypothetical protein